MTSEPMVRITDLTVAYRKGHDEVLALDRVSLDIQEGEAVGVIGESGSGKSTLALALLGLLPANSRVQGSIRYRGHELIGASESDLRTFRGTEIALVYQDALVSLNPVRTVGSQVAEAIERRWPELTRMERRRATIRALSDVGISAPEARVDQFPHEYSGGMRQRAAIAMALGAEPSLLIADEITTALDVTVKGEILELLAGLRRDDGMALMLVSHDLQVVEDTVDRVAVLYGGRIVEVGETSDVLTEPAHPYTEGLVQSVVTLDDPEIKFIPGDPPGSANEAPGCPFAPRCALRMGRSRCLEEVPALRAVGKTAHASACHYFEELIGTRHEYGGQAAPPEPEPVPTPPARGVEVENEPRKDRS